MAKLHFRWGNTPLDEAAKCGSESMVMLLEDAKSQELSKYPERAQEIQGSISFFLLRIYLKNLSNNQSLTS